LSLITREANILDEIHPELTPFLFDDPASEEPILKPRIREWIMHFVYSNADKFHPDSEQWAHLFLTGSLTTKQYSSSSDCDISLFVDINLLPEWDRAKLIAIMVQHCDGKKVPGSPFPLQCYVVSPQIPPELLFQSGLRAAYDINNDKWFIPPDPSLAHDVEREYTDLYINALQIADKMEVLLKYQQARALKYFRLIHTKRRKEQSEGKGDYGKWNIVYKMLAQKGIISKLQELSGTHS
jgi:hypothetical protein